MKVKKNYIQLLILKIRSMMPGSSMTKILKVNANDPEAADLSRTNSDTSGKIH